MKKKWIITAAALAVILVCALGGWAIVGRQSAAPQPTPTPAVATTPTPVGLPAFSTALPTPSATTPALPPVSTESTPPAETTLPSQQETVVEDENGNQTITPNWSTDKLPDNANVVPRQPEANINGGGGTKLPTDEDGIYRGDQVTPSPTPASPVTTPPSVTPDTESSSKPSTPPADSSNHKNGEISPDGSQVWFEGFGWVDRDTDSGGKGGVSGNPDDQLTGNKVGEM